MTGCARICPLLGVCLATVSSLRLATPEPPTEAFTDEHPKFMGHDALVNQCNRMQGALCNVTVRDSAKDPRCNQVLHSLAMKTHFNKAKMVLVGNGENYIRAFQRDLGVELIETVGLNHVGSYDLKDKTENSASVVLFNYVLHHAADDTIELLKAASSIATKYVIVAEDIKSMNQSHWKLEFEDDVVGTHRGDEEWKMLFHLLGMQLVHEFEPDCMFAEHHVDRKLYVLRPTDFSPPSVGSLPSISYHRNADGDDLVEESIEGEDLLDESVEGEELLDESVDGADDVNMPFGEIWECANTDFLQWAANVSQRYQALDVGGGRARLAKVLRNRGLMSFGAGYRCVDFNPTAQCPSFNGRNLTGKKDNQFQAVMFHSTLHHAADTTLSLLLDAKRVSSKYVIVSEDMKAARDAPYHLQWVQHKHDPHGTFRGDKEWKALFDLIGLELKHEAGPRMCGDDMDVGRKLYILEVPGSNLNTPESQGKHLSRPRTHVARNAQSSHTVKRTLHYNSTSHTYRE